MVSVYVNNYITTRCLLNKLEQNNKRGTIMNEYDPNDWPGDILDALYGGDDCPCNKCLVKVQCKKCYKDVCEERYDYYERKLKS